MILTLNLNISPTYLSKIIIIYSEIDNSPKKIIQSVCIYFFPLHDYTCNLISVIVNAIFFF